MTIPTDKDKVARARNILGFLLGRTPGGTANDEWRHDVVCAISLLEEALAGKAGTTRIIWQWPDNDRDGQIKLLRQAVEVLWAEVSALRERAGGA